MWNGNESTQEHPFMKRLETLESLSLVGESGNIDNKAMTKMITQKLKEEGKTT